MIAFEGFKCVASYNFMIKPPIHTTRFICKAHIIAAFPSLYAPKVVLYAYSVLPLSDFSPRPLNYQSSAWTTADNADI